MLCQKKKEKREEVSSYLWVARSEVWNSLDLMVPASCGSLGQGWAIKCSIFSTFGKDWNGLFSWLFWSYVKGKPLRDVPFLAAWFSGSRLGHDPFAFVPGPWGRSGRGSDSFSDWVGQYAVFAGQMDGWLWMKECLNLNEMTENKSFKLLKESLLLVRGGGLLFVPGSLPVLRAVFLNTGEKELLLWFL